MASNAECFHKDSVLRSKKIFEDRVATRKNFLGLGKIKINKYIELTHESGWLFTSYENKWLSYDNET